MGDLTLEGYFLTEIFDLLAKLLPLSKIEGFSIKAPFLRGTFELPDFYRMPFFSIVLRREVPENFVLFGVQPFRIGFDSDSLCLIFAIRVIGIF